jgi:hypothetical protein
VLGHAHLWKGELAPRILLLQGSLSKSKASSFGCIFMATWIILMWFLMHGTFMLSEQQFYMICTGLFMAFKMILKSKKGFV